MFNKLKNLFKFSSQEPVAPFFPDGERAYCIGDIHGRFDLLQNIHQKILEDSKDYEGAKKIIYLGDYIDRGMQSKEVLDELITNPLPGFESIHLRGNHEQTMLDFLQNHQAGPFWFRCGGQSTLYSYKVFVNKIPTKNEEFAEIQKQLLDTLSQQHLEFLNQTEYLYETGNYYFVHAGIDPDESLENQSPETIIWIKDKFIQSKKNHGKIIVHGHHITDKPELLSNRIGIDTGAYSSDRLTCLILENNRQSILQS